MKQSNKLNVKIPQKIILYEQNIKNKGDLRRI